MDWDSWAAAFYGTVAGGGVVVFAQYLADRRRAASSTAFEQGAARRANSQRQRDRLVDLNSRTADDVVRLRTALRVTDDTAGTADADTRAETLDELLFDHDRRHERALGLIASVSDRGVRDAAEHVYTTWRRWIAGEANRERTGAVNPVRSHDATSSLTDLAEATRDYLRLLDSQDVGAPRP